MLRTGAYSFQGDLKRMIDFGNHGMRSDSTDSGAAWGLTVSSPPFGPQACMAVELLWCGTWSWKQCKRECKIACANWRISGQGAVAQREFNRVVLCTAHAFPARFVLRVRRRHVVKGFGTRIPSNILTGSLGGRFLLHLGVFCRLSALLRRSCLSISTSSSSTVGTKISLSYVPRTPCLCLLFVDIWRLGAQPTSWVSW